MIKTFSSAAFSAARARVAAPGDTAADSLLDYLLFGPDERRGGLGDAPRRAAGEIWLSSCEAAGISPRAFEAARKAQNLVLSAESSLALPQWFDEIRRRLATLMADPDCAAILAASPVEAETTFEALARAVVSRPLAHIAAAPPERPEAALSADESFSLRDRYGLALPSDEIDAQVVSLTAKAVADGKDVVLHVADCSETGLGGPSRACVAALEQAFPDRLLVLIDGRQMRGERATASADLGAGRAILISGSTFAGGPIGAAALLLPPSLIEKISRVELPPALRTHAAALDWPLPLRERLRDEFGALADPRVGLRWECALAELECFSEIAPEQRAKIRSAFLGEVRRHLAATPWLKAADFHERAADAPSITPILTFDDSGRAIKTSGLRRALADPAARPGRLAARGRPVRLGGPVTIGARKALRLALGASQINDVSARLATGLDFSTAFQPLADDLRETFALWSELAQDLR